MKNNTHLFPCKITRTLTFLGLAVALSFAPVVYTMQQGLSPKEIEQALSEGKIDKLTSIAPKELAKAVLSELRKNRFPNLEALSPELKKFIYSKASDLEQKKKVLRTFGFASVQDLINFGATPDLIVTCDQNCSAVAEGVGLDLSSLGLTSIEGIGKITTQKPLVYIDLKNNNLATLPAYAFGAFPVLEMLDLSQNKLSELPVSLFTDNLKLLGVSFRNNRLTTLPQDLHGWPRMTALELSGNPFNIKELENIFNNVPHNRIGIPYGVARKIGTDQFQYPDPTVMSPCCLQVVKVAQRERTISKDQQWPERVKTATRDVKAFK